VQPDAIRIGSSRETLGKIRVEALLVVQGGANLRNDIAHGLVDDAAA
jgi:hypothetical protein